MTYNKETWGTGNTITSNWGNKIETAIDEHYNDVENPHQVNPAQISALSKRDFLLDKLDTQRRIADLEDRVFKKAFVRLDALDLSVGTNGWYIALWDASVISNEDVMFINNEYYYATTDGEFLTEASLSILNTDGTNTWSCTIGLFIDDVLYKSTTPRNIAPGTTSEFYIGDVHNLAAGQKISIGILSDATSTRLAVQPTSSKLTIQKL